MATTILNTPQSLAYLSSQPMPGVKHSGKKPFQYQQRSGEASPTTVEDVLAENAALRHTLQQQSLKQHASTGDNYTPAVILQQKHQPTLYEQSIRQRMEQPWWKRALIFGGAVTASLVGVGLLSKVVNHIPGVSKLSNHPNRWVSVPFRLAGSVAEWAAWDVLEVAATVGLGSLFD